jgi:hypothetical protein
MKVGAILKLITKAKDTLDNYDKDKIGKVTIVLLRINGICQELVILLSFHRLN